MLFSLGLQVAAVYVPFMQQALRTVPLGWADWGLMFLVALPVFLLAEAVKWLRYLREPPRDWGVTGPPAADRNCPLAVESIRPESDGKIGVS
jgi:Ca2+-transporting ATPase